MAHSHLVLFNCLNYGSKQKHTHPDCNKKNCQRQSQRRKEERKSGNGKNCAKQKVQYDTFNSQAISSTHKSFWNYFPCSACKMAVKNAVCLCWNRNAMASLWWNKSSQLFSISMCVCVWLLVSFLLHPVHIQFAIHAQLQTKHFSQLFRLYSTFKNCGHGINDDRDERKKRNRNCPNETHTNNGPTQSNLMPFFSYLAPTNKLFPSRNTNRK